MRNRRTLLFAVLAGVLTLSVTVGAVTFFVTRPAAAAPHSSTSVGTLTFVGDGAIGSGGIVSIDRSTHDQTPQEEEHDLKVPNTGGTLPPPPTVAPNPANTAVSTNTPGASGFNGLNHFDNRNAGTGAYVNTQFSLEPPDQALCVGNGFVMESVNTVIGVYRKSDKALVSGPTAINQFLGLAPEINRVTGAQGDFTSDPKCYFDPQLNRWFFTILQEDPAPSVRTHTYIAVTKTADPTGSWTIFNFDTTDDGLNGTPSHPDCPCLGDQPLIGADNYGFYVSTNEFSNVTGGFNGAQVYAMSKLKLVVAAAHSGATPQVVHIDASQELVPFGGLSYSIQPATTPLFGNLLNSQFSNEEIRNKGTEYFMSALQFGPAPLDNRIAVWALTNTRSLLTSSPNLTLHLKVVGSETYGQPAPAVQKSGPLPLRDAIAANLIVDCGGPCPTDPLEVLNSNDDRMNQTVYSAGKLFSGLNTVIGTGANQRVGAAWFIVDPSWNGATLNAKVSKQGYVAVGGGASVLFPAVSVNFLGVGAMAMTLSGPQNFPSAAYVSINGLTGVQGPVRIAGAGVGPEDGFSGYFPFVPDNVARWGDYGAAAVDNSDGSIWLASEYIGQTCTFEQYLADTTCGGTRTLLANWGTFVTRVATDTHGH
jgi:hypothetical protein